MITDLRIRIIADGADERITQIGKIAALPDPIFSLPNPTHSAQPRMARFKKRITDNSD